MPKLIPILSEDQIAAKVAEVGQKISTDYRNRQLVLVGVLKGAFVFLADLMRHLTIPAQVDFVSVSSYGSDMASSGKIKLTKPVGLDLKNKDVLIVEDIIDTGQTLLFLIDCLKSFGPRSVKVCALIDKKERRQVDVSVDYTCHQVPEGFLVGYGLDFAEDYRGLKGIHHLQL